MFYSCHYCPNHKGKREKKRNRLSIYVIHDACAPSTVKCEFFICFYVNDTFFSPPENDIRISKRNKRRLAAKSIRALYFSPVIPGDGTHSEYENNSKFWGKQRTMQSALHFSVRLLYRSMWRWLSKQWVHPTFHTNVFPITSRRE